MNTLKTFFAATLFAALPLAAVDTAMLQLAMPDAQVLAGADVDKVKVSPFGEAMLARMTAQEKDLAKFIDLTGFDPRRDLREILFASRNTSGKSGGIVIARGTFDEGRILGAITSHGATVTPYQGINIFVDGKGKDGAAAFAGGMVFGGEVAEVKGAIDRYRANSKTLPDLAAKAQDASARYDVWAVTNAGPDKFAGRVSGNPDVQAPFKGEALQSITQMSGGVRFGVNVQVGGEAVTRSAQDATALVDVYKFLAQMLVLNAPKTGPAASPLQAFLGSAQVTASGNTVNFTASMPNADLEKLLGPKASRRAALRK